MTTREKIEKLVKKAQEIMQKTHDPVHDLSHAERTARVAAELGRKSGLGEKQLEALTIAAWWHDASRTMTNGPSLIIMPLLDDTFSAFMLWFYTIRFGLFGSVAGMATRLIFCKSLGTGKILTRLLLRKKNRIMLDILKDADALDVLHIDRIKKIFPFVQSSAIYQRGYKVMCWWMMKSGHLRMKTRAGLEYLVKLLREFLAWIKQKVTLEWHRENFGEKWVRKSILRVEKFLLMCELRTNTNVRI